MMNVFALVCFTLTHVASSQFYSNTVWTDMAYEESYGYNRGTDWFDWMFYGPQGPPRSDTYRHGQSR